jgi:hypothetical protein
MVTTIGSYYINEVAHWLNPESKVQLPVIQRGFVWKVSQIECLWDSIFRGYPIGSVMLSPVDDKLMLLDGQQRITSIALGFYNPWEKETQNIGNAINLPVIWIDVCPKQKTDTQEFVFRVVTRSHPWGYQLQHNANILSVSFRRKASEMYKKLYNPTAYVYTKLLPTQRLPYDAYCPIPLCFLLEAVEKNKEASWLVEKCKKHIPEGYRTSYMSEDETYFSLLESIDVSSIMAVGKDRVLQTKIPAVTLPEDLLIDKRDTSSDESTLFVRLNSQGTKIEGEELMYSMFKVVYPEAKELVDRLGMNMLPPSRVIALVARLVQSKKQYVANISLAQFRKYIQDSTFVEEMKDLVGDEDYSPIKEKITQAIEILRYGNVPDVVVKKFIRESSNGFMLLLHWLLENKGVVIDDQKKKIICARLYRNHWFGDINYFTSKNWDSVCDTDFWDEKFYKNEEWIYQHPFVEPSTLENFLISRLDNSEEQHDITPDDVEIWNVWANSLPRPVNLTEEEYYNRIQDGWRNFLWRLLGTRDKSLILLAQRDYINSTFKEFNQLEDLEDSNTPWDWDHIYPSSWVYRQWQIDPRTRLWEWRIGNFRAMLLTDNRSENNNLSPAERFEECNSDYFIKENDLEYWRQLDASHKYIKEDDKKHVIIHAKAIIIRSVNIYENFLKMFFD